MKSDRDERKICRGAATSFTLLALAAIFALTLRTGAIAGPSHPDSALCVWCGDTGTTNLILNVLLFVPLGAGLALLGWRRSRVVLTAAGLSLAIELLQLTVLSGRYPALGDLLANTLGGFLGHVATTAVRYRDRPLSRRAFLARAFLAWILALFPPALAALAFRPHPGSARAPWFGQWANVLENLDPFGGLVLDVRLSGIPVPMGRLAGEEQLREAWHQQPLRFEAGVRTGPVPRRRALVATIAEDLVGWPAAIWQEGEDAVLSLRLAASDLEVGSPHVRLPAAFSVPLGTELVLSIEAGNGVLTARAQGRNPERRATVPLRVSKSWVTMWPWSKAFAGETPFRSLTWLIGIGGIAALLLGFWTGKADAAMMGAGLAALVPPITHAALPAWAGLPGGTVAEWAATVGATVLGFVLGARAARREARAG